MVSFQTDGKTLLLQAAKRTFRQHLNDLALRVLCSPHQSHAADGVVSTYRTRILAGPLRGSVFVMPARERLAFAFGIYESHVVQEIGKFLKPGGIGYDVGANAGYLTLVMARAVGSAGRVFAFEPDQRNLAVLRENIARNAPAIATAVPKAVNADSAPVQFATFDYSFVGHIAGDQTPSDARVTRLEAISLDDFVYRDGNPPPNFVKIDVEGAESQVFAGASRLIEEARPVLLAEVRQGKTWDFIRAEGERHRYEALPMRSGWQMERDGLADIIFVPK